VRGPFVPLKALKTHLIYYIDVVANTSDRIPTWNEKLGKLGVRKNVTSEEWKKIYLHCLPRLEDPTRVKGDLKLKRTKLGTEVIVRGRKYNWDQAWKNMKSAKAIGQLLLPGGRLWAITTMLSLSTLIWY
jgi:ornithine carbamoyltransferase